MSLLDPPARAFAEAVARLAYTNPFVPARVEAEQAALGDAFAPQAEVWAAARDAHAPNPNVLALTPKVERAVEQMRAGLLQAPETATMAERDLYGDMVLYLLYNRYDDDLLGLVIAPGRPPRPGFYRRFAEDLRRFVDVPGAPVLPAIQRDPAHVFAAMFQVRRAFHHIYHSLIGFSAPAVRLRAEVWHSVFTHDMRRYQRALFRRMHDFTTLITGPSGTGKELVARAIGLSRYVPFDASSGQFADHFAEAFHPLNLSALSPTLIESELFGHRKGAFTGAVADRSGWLEICRAFGTVFLDEIGELDPAIQVKLLRVLQDRGFQRIGETTERRFTGKIIAATNRDLMVEMESGQFRADLYYRLCADLVTTPALATQLADRPEDLSLLVEHLARRILGEDEAEVIETLTLEVIQEIERGPGLDYPWPGNVRELEQCVRNVAIRGRYNPPTRPDLARGPLDGFLAQVAEGQLDTEALLGRYVTLIYRQTGSYVQTARRVGLDRRTVKRYVDEGWLETLKQG